MAHPPGRTCRHPRLTDDSLPPIMEVMDGNTPLDMAAALDEVKLLAEALKRHVTLIQKIAETRIGALRNGGRVLTCGNGGSAAEAMHLSEELVGRYQRSRKPLPSICLCSDESALTCIANDWEYAEVFARQVEAHGRKGDVLVGLSTS